MSERHDLSGIGFGCGRLRGGLEARNSMRLLERAFELGIRHFDVAPSYGDGAAEAIVGKTLGDVRREVQIVSKVGLAARPGSALYRGLRALARELAKPLVGQWVARQGAGPRQGDPQAKSYGRFVAAELAERLSLSLEALRTSYLDAWLLHEPSASDPAADVAAALELELAAGRVLALGVGTGDAYASLPKYGQVAQCRVGLDVMTAGTRRSLLVHGLLRFRQGQESPDALAHAMAMTGDPQSAWLKRDELFMPALLAATLVRQKLAAKVLISTTSTANLERFARAYAEACAATSDETAGDAQAFLSTQLARYSRGA